MAIPKTSLGAYLIAAGFVLLVASFVPMPDARVTLVLTLTGQLIPIIGISYMQKDAKRFGDDHAKRINIALIIGLVALLTARFVLRGIVKRHDISPDAFDGLPIQAAVDVLIAGLAVLALWTLAAASERKLLMAGGVAVLVSSAITALTPRLANGGTNVTILSLVALALLVLSYLALATTAALYARRFAANPAAPLDPPSPA